MRLTVEFLDRLPQIIGVYLFYGKDDSILYIGKAKNIKKRVCSYFKSKYDFNNKKEELINKVNFIDVIPLASEFETLLLEAKLIKIHQPRYNVAWKDDKRFIHIKITNEEFPRVLLSRKAKEEEQLALFGPFPSTKIAKDILSYIRQIFPFCTQSQGLKRRCFYTHLGLCHPCPGDIRKKQGKDYLKAKKIYLKNIKQIKSLLEGQIQKVSRGLRLRMLTASKRNEFEKAAIFRDKLEKLQFLVNCYKPIDLYWKNPYLTYQTWHNEQKSLKKILSKYFTQLNLLKKIECYDISCLSNKFAVGSMVAFIDGQPAKDSYRRFRIKGKNPKSDFEMLKEIIRRRLSHKEWLIPDLFVIDGGKPQLLFLKRVLEELRVNVPIIGLAKKEEELVIPQKNNFVKIKLPAFSPALHLIQRLRDEAHRFASKYHKHLRLKYILSSS